ncbi:MAG: hypothetical protein ACTIC1_13435 [Brevibacterium sp.]
MTLYSLVLALLPGSKNVLIIVMWAAVVVALVAIVTISSVRTRFLREKTYRPDPNHSLSIRVDDFQGSMEAYPNANIAFGAHDTFDPAILHTDSLHSLIYEEYFDGPGSNVAETDEAKADRHKKAIERSAGPLPARGHYPYGTVAVLPIRKTPHSAAPGSEERTTPGTEYQRRAYLVVNSTWGTHTFTSFGNVRAVTNPLNKIVSKHHKDHDASATLLVALIGTGKSSSVSSMSSLLTLIDEYFHQREISRSNPGSFDPISNVIVSLRPNELQAGTVDLEVVHQYCAAKLKAFSSK